MFVFFAKLFDNDIFINLFCAVLGWIFGGIWNYGLKLYRENDKLLNFIGINYSSPVSICYGNIQSTEYRSPLCDYLPKQKFDYGDIQATLVVYDRFRHKFSNKITSYSNEVPKELRKGNIIAIGGPKWNKTTQEYIGKLGSPFYFTEGTKGLIEKRKNHSLENIHRFNITKLKDGGVEVEDFGCIICARNGYLSKDIPVIMLVIGYSTFGVLFAADELKKNDGKLIRDMKNSLSGSKKFAIMVKGKVKLDEDGQIVSEITTNIETLVPETDFLPPSDYSYSKKSNES